MDNKILDEVSVTKSRKPLYISIAIVAALVLSYFFVPGVRQWLDEAWNVLTSGDEQRIHNWVDQFGWFGPVLIIIAMVVQMFLIVIPSWLLIIVSIIAYGPIWGSLIVMVAIFAASSVGYMIGKYFGPALVQRLIGYKTERKISEFIEHYGLWAIIVMRLNPMFSSDAISLMAGILRMGYWRFIGATLIGVIPLVAVIAALGEISSGATNALIYGSVIALVLFIAYVWWDRRKKRLRQR
jgi:uncharacterized membrane protein YdjX (TVP38/TMEM64 family)